jgi:hypothetical protein
MSGYQYKFLFSDHIIDQTSCKETTHSSYAIHTKPNWTTDTQAGAQTGRHPLFKTH